MELKLLCPLADVIEIKPDQTKQTHRDGQTKKDFRRPLLLDLRALI